MHEMENRDQTFQSLRGGILADAPGLGPQPFKILFLLNVFIIIVFYFHPVCSMF